MKPGTKIEAIVAGGDDEPATIARPTAREKLGLRDGWHIVRFATGGRLCLHHTGFRVIRCAS